MCIGKWILIFKDLRSSISSAVIRFHSGLGGDPI